MAGKARRVASRQAQLGRRRKRQQNRPEAGKAAVTESKPAVDSTQPTSTELDAVAEVPVQEAPEPAAPPARPAPRPPRPSPVAARSADPDLAPTRGGARGRRERIATQANILPEIRRILAMSATVLVVIIVLGIVL